MTAVAKFRVRIQADLQWRSTIGNGGNYVAVCDALKLTLQAATWAELMEDTSEVLDSIFRDLLSSNELDSFLRTHGWSVLGQVPRQVENVRFDVPFFFVPEMANSHGPQKHLSE